MKPPRLLPTLLCFLPVSLLLAEPPAPPAPAPPQAPAETDFVRFEENDKGAQLQTAIATYRNAQGVTVDLIGAIHIADKNYYDVLNAYFEGYDALLYEMVGDPIPRAGHPDEYKDEDDNKGSKGEPPAPHPADSTPAAEAEKDARARLNWLRPLYNVMKNTLKLHSQLECIDYTKRNFVHADMTARAFAAKQEEKGESFIQLWVRMMKVQALSAEGSRNDPGLLKILEILCQPDSSTELKRLMGRMFDSVEKVMSGMEGPDGSVILTERNKVALEVLKIHLGLGKKKLGIFYGAAHLPDMEKRLLEMGFRRESVEWLNAWELPPEPSALKRKDRSPPKPPAPAPPAKGVNP